jgi:hypothetical protein
VGRWRPGLAASIDAGAGTPFFASLETSLQGVGLIGADAPHRKAALLRFDAGCGDQHIAWKLVLYPLGGLSVVLDRSDKGFDEAASVGGFAHAHHMGPELLHIVIAAVEDEGDAALL